MRENGDSSKELELIAQKESSKEGQEMGGREDRIRELREMFKMGNTQEFWTALQEGRVDDAKRFIDHIGANPGKYEWYSAEWLSLRRKDIELCLKRLESGETAKIWSKDEARQKIAEACGGIGDTKQFRVALGTPEGRISARKFLDFVAANLKLIPQYQAGFDKWLSDRERELNEAGGE